MIQIFLQLFIYLNCITSFSKLFSSMNLIIISFSYILQITGYPWRSFQIFCVDDTICYERILVFKTGILAKTGLNFDIPTRQELCWNIFKINWSLITQHKGERYLMHTNIPGNYEDFWILKTFCLNPNFQHCLWRRWQLGVSLCGIHASCLKRFYETFSIQEILLHIDTNFTDNQMQYLKNIKSKPFSYAWEMKAAYS